MRVKNLKTMLLLAAITMFFVGCSKGDDEPQNPNPLVGVWQNIHQWGNYGDIYVATATITFNSNRTFIVNVVEEENGSVTFQNIMKGTYSIHDKDKVIIHTTFDDYYEGDPNVDKYEIAPFKKFRDVKGEYC